MVTRLLVAMFSLATLSLCVHSSYGQTYPDKPVRIITAGEGGLTDILARMVAQGISVPLRQPVVVESRGGNPAVAVVTAKPDGYTLFFASGSFLTEPLVRQTGYDPVKDFSPVSAIVTGPTIFVVNASLGVSSVKELIALAKAKPGVLNYASGGVGKAAHLGGELFKSMAGINMVHIPYSATGQALTAVLGGQADFMIITPLASQAQVKAGKLKALAITSPQRSPIVPDLPTVAESGLPGYEMVQTTAMYAPAKTPAAIIKTLNLEIDRFVNRPEVKQDLLSQGAEVVGGPPEQLAASNKATVERMTKVIKDANIKAD